MTPETTSWAAVPANVTRVARGLAWVAAALWWLLAAGGGLVVALLAVLAVRTGRARMSLPVAFTPAPGDHALGVGPAAGGADLGGVSGTITLAAPPLLILAALAVVVAGVLLVLVVIWQLRGLLAALAAGRPFTARSAHRIRIIAAVVGIGELGRAGVVWAAGWWLRGNVSVSGLAVTPSFSLNWEVLVLAALLWLLAEVFAMGTRLQHDHDLTI